MCNTKNAFLNPIGTYYQQRFRPESLCSSLGFTRVYVKTYMQCPVF